MVCDGQAAAGPVNGVSVRWNSNIDTSLTGITPAAVTAETSPSPRDGARTARSAVNESLGSISKSQPSTVEHTPSGRWRSRVETAFDCVTATHGSEVNR